MLSHLDLFTGIGGFTLAAEVAGFQTIGHAEVEPYCCKILKQHWPQIKNYGDIRTADFSGLRGNVTVLSAGVPCQPASLAGKRRGKADDRWLWDTVLDVAGAVEPAWCIFENPPGILTLDEFGGVLLRLGALGYAIRAFGVPANSVGAKHRRQRIFIIGHSEHLIGRTEWAAKRSKEHAGPDGIMAHAGCEHETDGERRRAEIRERSCADAERPGQDAEALANAGAPRLEEPRQPGEQQAVIGSGGLDWFRLTQPPLCRRVDGISDRSHRLKALGNACVPAQCLPFFLAIAQVEQQL